MLNRNAFRSLRAAASSPAGAAAGLTLGFSPLLRAARAAPPRPARTRSTPSDRIAPGQHRHRAVEAHRHGPGHLHRPRHRWSPRSSTPTGRRCASSSRRPTPSSTTTCSSAPCRAPAARPRSPTPGTQLRQAGAAARAMLVAAAADGLGRRLPAEITRRAEASSTHALRQAGARSASSPSAAASAPSGGRQAEGAERLRAHRQRDVPRARHRGQDHRHGELHASTSSCPGMLTAVVAHPPRFGAKVKSFDAAAATRGHGRGRRRRRSRRASPCVAQEHLGGDEGPRGAQGRLGRRTAPRARGSAELFADYRELANDAGQSVAQHGRRRRKPRSPARRKVRRGGLRVPLPRARRRWSRSTPSSSSTARRLRRGLGRLAVPDGRPGDVAGDRSGSSPSR